MSTPGPDAPPGSAVQYAYMFEKDKGPTKQLDALLRAIARHIILELGDKADTHLTPSKLAAFYKSVGGDYDSLFADMPHSSISFIWQVTGCQHTLQPTHDDFAPPSIPALTFRGFSRWESLEILLGPDEHVPFMQYAVKNWDLKHPETGEQFPPDLPANVFPAETDMDVDRWHKSCAEKLRSEAASSAEEAASPTHPNAAPHPQPQAEPKFTYVRINPFQPASPRSRPGEPDYFGRPVSFVHIPARNQGQRRPDRSPRQEDTAEERMRRKSFSDYPSAPPEGEMPHQGYSAAYLDPSVKRSTQPRRHSHPRRVSSDSSDSSEPPGPVHQNTKRRRHPASPPPPSVRRIVPPSAPNPPPAAQNVPPSFRPHRADMRPDESKRRNIPSPLGSFRNKLSETVSHILPNGFTSDRPRPGSRQGSVNDGIHPRRNREPYHPSRLSHSYSDIDSDTSSGDALPEEDVRRRRRMREERERERLRRGRPREPERDWEEERDSGGRRDRPRMRRPDTQRRTSSHADAERQRDSGSWDPRDRDRPRDDRRKWDKRGPEDATPSPAPGVAGRRYQEPTYG
ncbi:hypothetical protein HIM_04622 [Hirsutella minnesotensis 3608]|uniref:DUF7514 domain-containing protein n=1 Tax=Hirsutella minnesotensis 3608 TaxID=1043627 RepID=A0A0F7ZLA3_9HYPO|nr:hypothetical protein HIM_04622 [Hirsutella minnesotensis 3608]